MSRSRHKRKRQRKERRSSPVTGRGIALYRCVRCSHRFYAEPGMHDCPACGHMYVRWLNYEELEAAGAFDDVPYMRRSM